MACETTQPWSTHSQIYSLFVCLSCGQCSLLCAIPQTDRRHLFGLVELIDKNPAGLSPLGNSLGLLVAMVATMECLLPIRTEAVGRAAGIIWA
jgi:hypothetical protein